MNVRALSSPDSAFIIPSIRAVLLLQLTPAQVQGRPVFVRVEQSITWRAEPAPEGAAESAAGGAGSDRLPPVPSSDAGWCGSATATVGHGVD